MRKRKPASERGSEKSAFEFGGYGVCVFMFEQLSLSVMLFSSKFVSSIFFAAAVVFRICLLVEICVHCIRLFCSSFLCWYEHEHFPLLRSVNSAFSPQL